MVDKQSEIVPLSRNTVHKICSGQVVLSLAIAVKELIENAIDAGATNVEIRLKDYGSESIEVNDNGTGVQNENFQTLTLKHYTSKLREFDDLESIQTLGFRGEALSSLCALSKLTIITRHTSVEYAMKIEYDASGKIKSQLPAAREIGTTTILENLFESLPVRRKEFVKNIKREYGKMCQLLNAYCLVSKGIKFTCINQTKTLRNVIVATEGSNSIRDNVISVFGTKQLSSLVDVQLCVPDEKILEEFTIKSFDPNFCTFEFIISSAVHGSGRSSTDRQFFYINSRPFESSKVIKIVNEVYRQFNSNQYPFVFLNIAIERGSVDVNVTPDKRQIFIEKEKLLLAVLKSSLLATFKDCPSTLKMQNVETRGLKRANDDETKLDLNKKRIIESHAEIDDSHVKLNELISIASNLNSKSDVNKCLQQSTMERFVEVKDKYESESDENELTPEKSSFKCLTERIDVRTEKITDRINKKYKNEIDEEPERVTDEFDVKVVTKTRFNPIKINSSPENIDDQIESQPLEQKELERIEKKALSPIGDKDLITFDFNPKRETHGVTVRCSIQYIKDALKACQTANDDEDYDIKIRFRSEINPSSNKSAEQELQKQITKDMFKNMKIIGQFNLGFIVTKFEDNLFIVDQHASDEKYNFEQLQLTTVLERQILVNPKPIELPSGNEELLIENLEVFRKNGFNFDIHHDAPATKKIFITSIPMSKNYLFGKDDIEEMLFMLQEDVNHTVCRPSRIRGMFASRACRKSVMVGCPLSLPDMRRIIDHMSEIDQPWNCPHGRPTMRHLINLKLIDKD